MGIILGLLKIAGIILLIILAFILAFVCLILFIPFRYRLKARYPAEENPDGYAAVSWLGHIVSVRGIYRDKKLNVQFKILGIPVFDLIRRTRNTERRRAREEAKKKRRSEAEAAKASVQKEGQTPNLEEKAAPDEKPAAGKAQTPAIEAIPIPSDDRKSSQTSEETFEKTPGNDSGGEDTGPQSAPESNGGSAEDQSAGDGKERRRRCFMTALFNKIRLFFRKIKDLFIKIRKALLNLQETLQKTSDRVKKAGRQIEYYRDLFAEDDTKALLTKIWGKAGTVIRMIRPKYLRLYLIIGTGDPAVTAQILAVQGILYPLAGGRIDIVPVFDEVHLEGDVDVRGCITTFTLLICALQVVFDKRSKRFIKRLKYRQDSPAGE